MLHIDNGLITTTERLELIKNKIWVKSEASLFTLVVITFETFHEVVGKNYVGIWKVKV